MTTHKSDCAVHNAPALEVGPCDCGAELRWKVADRIYESIYWGRRLLDETNEGTREAYLAIADQVIQIVEAKLVAKLLTPSHDVRVAMCNGKTWIEDWQLGIKAFARENNIPLLEEVEDA